MGGTGGADRAGVRMPGAVGGDGPLPDRGYAATSGPLATTPVNAARANGGTRGGMASPGAAIEYA
ncbi:MAG: hypothetical protein MUF25_15685 [Pirellulaceae bacterium]|nr:hypothetical protein [Pirellulaceae bacterium]